MIFKYSRIIKTIQSDVVIIDVRKESEPIDIDPIALSAAPSIFITFIAAFILLYDWYA
ncbi:MAG: hypothetical protein ACFFAE_11215 [Candidatus Hodarchaeota archaeon]